MAAPARAPIHPAQHAEQLRLDEEWAPALRSRPSQTTPLCANCRAREARYGFREHDTFRQTQPARSRTLCFECFRAEIDRRQRLAAHLARGWNTEPAPPKLPLSDTLSSLDHRRRRAQIAARRALGL